MRFRELVTQYTVEEQLVELLYVQGVSNPRYEPEKFSFSSPRKRNFNSCIPLIFCSRVFQGRQQHTVLEGTVAFSVRFLLYYIVLFCWRIQGSEKGEEITVWKSLPLLGSFPSLYLKKFFVSAPWMNSHIME